jgi:hypothetical protein
VEFTHIYLISSTIAHVGLEDYKRQDTRLFFFETRQDTRLIATMALRRHLPPGKTMPGKCRHVVFFSRHLHIHGELSCTTRIETYCYINWRPKIYYHDHSIDHDTNKYDAQYAVLGRSFTVPK